MEEEEDATTQMQEAMILIRKTAVILAFVYGFIFPSYGKMADVEDVKEVIKMYNKIVIEESKSERHKDIRTFITMMEEIATHDVSRKLYIWIQAWHDNGLFMNANLQNLRFEAVKIKGNKAEVLTNESWVYSYYDRRIEKVVLPDTKVQYKVKYQLKKINNKWLIFKIKVLEEKQRKIQQEDRK